MNHPPVDDIPGRLMGEKIGLDAVSFALPYFSKTPDAPNTDLENIFPNPTTCGVVIELEQEGRFPVQVFQADGKLLLETNLDFGNGPSYLNLEQIHPGVLMVVVRDKDGKIIFQRKVVKAK